MSIAGKLIKIVKKYPILYDPLDSDYRNNEKKDKLWDEIAVQLNESDVMEVKKRWRNLRDTYVKLLKLVKNSKKDPVFEAAAIGKYHRWIWTKEMEYFRSHFTYGNQANIRIPDPPEVIKKEPKLKKRKMIKRELPPEIETESPATRQKTSTSERLTKSVNLPKTETGCSQEISSLDLDATDRLFLAHAQNIKQFSARRQALTKLKIAEVIMEQEILHQEDFELASISATTAKGIFNRRRREEDSPPAFETVCGYGSDEVDEEHLRLKTETTDDENPVAIDDMNICIH